MSMQQPRTDDNGVAVLIGSCAAAPALWGCLRSGWV